MPARKQLAGQRFGMLTAIEWAGEGRWQCKCDCGQDVIVQSGNLVSGNSRSCGCLSRRLDRFPTKDLTGQRFSELLVIGLAPRERLGVTNWLCRCNCGNEKIINAGTLQAGTTKSCGCLSTAPDHRRGETEPRNRKHGQSRKTGGAYKSWTSMLGRCRNPNAPNFKYYGARGISVCERWLRFADFYADMGDRPEGHTLDRIDNAGNYEPGNCRWSTPKQQANNRRPHGSSPPLENHA